MAQYNACDQSEIQSCAGNSDQVNLVHLPPQTELKDGSAILTSGIGGVLPFGLVLGHVRYTENGDMFVELSSDLKNVSYVKIIDYKLDTTLKP